MVELELLLLYQIHLLDMLAVVEQIVKLVVSVGQVEFIILEEHLVQVQDLVLQEHQVLVEV